MKKWIKWAFVGSVLSAFLLFLVPVIGLFVVSSAVAGEAEQRQTVVGSLSKETLAWEESVVSISKDCGLDPQYKYVVLAIIEFESGGVGTDIMNSSRTGYNTRYPQVQNGIKTPAYSIECGIKHLKEMLDATGVKSIDDKDNLMIAIQAYNYGKEYISFAKANSGHSSDVSEKYYTQNNLISDADKYITYAESVWGFIPKKNDGSEGGPIGEDTGGFIYPMWGPIVISAGYGYYDPFDDGNIRMHHGVDFPVAYGQKVRATKGGVVTFATWSDSYGYFVEIDHGNKMSTLYGHNSRLNVKVGQQVRQGEVIAFGGSTGLSSGPHIHLELSINGKRVDPQPYLPKTNNWGE